MTDQTLDAPLPSASTMGPYRIPVRLVLPATIRRMLRAQRCDGEASGLWDDARRVIYIDRTISRHRQWDVYWHEVRHAITDLEAWQKGGL